MNDLRQRALRLLTRREHGRVELSRKLTHFGTQEEIAQVLNELQNEGLLSDRRAADAYVRARGSRLGAGRIRQELRQRGLDPALADTELAELPDEMERARQVWQRKFSAPARDVQEWARQARFLQGRGFSPELIRKLLQSIRRGDA